MSTVGKVIFSELATDPTMAGLVGNRIYPATVPARAASPYVVYMQDAADPSDEKDGPSVLDEVRMALMIAATEYDQVQDIATQARTLLDRFSGEVMGVNVQSTHFVDQGQDDYNPELGLYTTTQKYRFRVNR